MNIAKLQNYVIVNAREGIHFPGPGQHLRQRKLFLAILPMTIYKIPSVRGIYNN